MKYVKGVAVHTAFVLAFRRCVLLCNRQRPFLLPLSFGAWAAPSAPFFCPLFKACVMPRNAFSSDFMRLSVAMSVAVAWVGCRPAATPQGVCGQLCVEGEHCQELAHVQRVTLTHEILEQGFVEGEALAAHEVDCFVPHVSVVVVLKRVCPGGRLCGAASSARNFVQSHGRSHEPRHVVAERGCVETLHCSTTDVSQPDHVPGLGKENELVAESFGVGGEASQ